jgi:hypothetical protein
MPKVASATFGGFTLDLRHDIANGSPPGGPQLSLHARLSIGFS